VTADLIIFPGANPAATPSLPASDRIKVIQWIAKWETDLGDGMALALLRLAAHPSLTGEALTEAWKIAREAIQIANDTDPDDDELGFHPGADRALTYLVHGYYGGSAA
jgi:hypothetical protein